MAESLVDCEFWLPPRFLTDEEDVVVEKISGFSSDLSSPIESVFGSTETESDDDDYMSELTREIARATLEEGLSSTKGRMVSGSPQSTLCTFGSLCGCRQSSNRECGKAHSPPVTRDLLYAAAGEVARLKMKELHGYNNGSSLLGPARKPYTVSVPLKTLNSDSLYLADQSLSQHKLYLQQLQLLNQQQLLKQQAEQFHQLLHTHHQSQKRSRTTNPRHFGLTQSAWPTLQQSQLRSDIRRVYQSNTPAKRESVGTGVFLPRQCGATRPETRAGNICRPDTVTKRPGSNVLLPARVVQALNLKLNEIGDAVPSYQPPVIPNYSTNHGAMSYQKRNLSSQTMMNQEVLLPQEWSY